MVLFDADQVIDAATYEDPKQPSIGIDQVWVNGVTVFADGVHTDARPGRMLRYRSSD